MKVIDLSQTLVSNMPVYPGDPQVKIKQVHFLKKQGWRLRKLSFGSHTGTHVDAFAHMDTEGQTVDKIPLKKFFGQAKIVFINGSFPKNTGLIFKEGKLKINLFTKIKKACPLFVAVGDQAEMSVALEKQLLRAKILTFTDLVNLDKLPEKNIFKFFGAPLKIKDGDGSPIRAFAIVG